MWGINTSSLPLFSIFLLIFLSFLPSIYSALICPMESYSGTIENDINLGYDCVISPNSYDFQSRYKLVIKSGIFINTKE